MMQSINSMQRKQTFQWRSTHPHSPAHSMNSGSSVTPFQATMGLEEDKTIKIRWCRMISWLPGSARVKCHQQKSMEISSRDPRRLWWHSVCCRISQSTHKIEKALANSSFSSLSSSLTQPTKLIRLPTSIHVKNASLYKSSLPCGHCACKLI
jgi:hypothetical protein